MKKLRNEICYGVGCACMECRKASGVDFEVIAGFFPSIEEAKAHLKESQAGPHFQTFLVKETIAPVKIPQRKPKARKAA